MYANCYVMINHTNCSCIYTGVMDTKPVRMSSSHMVLMTRLELKYNITVKLGGSMTFLIHP